MKIDKMNWKKERDRKAVMEIEQAAFPSEMRSTEEDLAQYASAKGSVGLVVRNELCDNSQGYALAVPLETVGYPGCKEDLDLGKHNSAYVESLAVMPGERPVVLRRLLSRLEQELERTFSYAKMHVPVDEKLYHGLIAFGAKEVSRHDDFMRFGRTFAYLEVPLR